jgi:hypothetical protein
MSSPTPYHRCLHCKGFYETSFPQCKWCKYQIPLLNADGSPKVFPDRESCRTIQIAEWEQLPDHLKTDPMGPPANDLTLVCNCLHCGPDGHLFEAVEMRWMENEQMWACPCTTCGGRGFQFDIHSAEQKWQCCECGHFYTPPNNDFRPENACCPKCGCKNANGWFDDGYDESALGEEFEDPDEFDDEPPDDADAGTDAETGARGDTVTARDENYPNRANRDRTADDFLDEPLPWEDNDDDDDGPEYDLGITWKESDDDRAFPTTFDPDAPIPFADDDDKIPDDIDYPRFFRSRDDDKNTFNDLNDDDIPF